MSLSQVWVGRKEEKLCLGGDFFLPRRRWQVKAVGGGSSTTAGGGHEEALPPQKKKSFLPSWPSSAVPLSAAAQPRHPERSPACAATALGSSLANLPHSSRGGATAPLFLSPPFNLFFSTPSGFSNGGRRNRRRESGGSASLLRLPPWLAALPLMDWTRPCHVLSSQAAAQPLVCCWRGERRWGGGRGQDWTEWNEKKRERRRLPMLPLEAPENQ